MTNTKVPITVAYGDGIGPEIMEASLRILTAAGAQLDIDVIEVGEKVYLRGHPTGVEPGAWESLRRTKVFYKAPITTPQGGGYKSLNVTTRKIFGLYANVRPCVSYHPFVATKHPIMDVVIIRENEEDLYAGVEHRQTNQMYQCLKLVSRPGCEKIIRYAFEYARMYNRRKVTCFAKDNIMKLTDGLFHQVFDEIAKEYPSIENEMWIVDIGAAKLATAPENFDVVVMPNLYGDIISDITAQMTGSVGLAGSANIGDHCAMFEAIHGSAPRRAGQNIANPSGLLLAGILMLVHIGQYEAAAQAHNAWLKTIEDGTHTYDIFREGSSKKKVGTKEFADAVIARIGQKPSVLKAVTYSHVTNKPITSQVTHKKAIKQLVGVDVFIDWDKGTPRELGEALQKLSAGQMTLYGISNRGVKVYPDGHPETFCTDHWRCRFLGKENEVVTKEQLFELLHKIHGAGFDIIKTENLYTFDGVAGFSAMHG